MTNIILVVYVREMEQINLQTNEISGKTIKELEKLIRKPEGISGIFAQWKDQFIPIGITLLLIIMAVVIWNLKHEVSELQTKISHLNSENASLKGQLDEQVNQVLPALKLPDNKGTEEFISHRVQEGDCFENISERYYQTGDYASELARLNGLTITSTLQIGQLIKVPKEAGKLNSKKEP